VVPAGRHALLGGLALEDILSQGGDREPRPRPRRLAVIVALVALVAGGAVYLGLSRHSPAPAATHRAPVTPSAGPTALSLPPEPDGIAGQTLAWNRALRLPAAGTQPVWFSPASGRSEQIVGLPANRSGYQFSRVAGGWAVQASMAAPAACGGCAGAPAPVWFLPDGARSVTMAGPANLVAPAATAGALWLTSYAPGATMTTAAGTAREVGAAGALGRPVTLPPGYAIVQGTDRGLLLAPVSRQPGAADKLWDPATAQTSQAFHGVLAASPGRIALASRCAPKCGVQVLELATGRHTTVVLPVGNTPTSGAFSPDGKFLALQVSYGNTGDGGELAMQLQVASATSGRLTTVPGTWVSSDALVGFGWPAGGDSLVAEFNFTTKTELASWHPGASHPAVSIVPLGRGQPSLILG
jgi:hypothetical protein